MLIDRCASAINTLKALELKYTSTLRRLNGLRTKELNARRPEFGSVNHVKMFIAYYIAQVGDLKLSGCGITEREVIDDFLLVRMEGKLLEWAVVTREEAKL